MTVKEKAAEKPVENPYAVDRDCWSASFGEEGTATELCLSIIILGASGDLAHKYTFPILSQLFAREGLLPKATSIVGFARSEYTDEGLRNEVREQLPGDDASKDAFLKRVRYVRGNYDSPDGYKELHRVLSDTEAAHPDIPVGRLFYFALPPEIYMPVLPMIKQHCSDVGPHSRSWVRLIIEKPFGRDVESAEDLSNATNQLFSEEQVYRIDHFTAKDSIQNIMMLRFANTFLSSVWNRQHIESVQVNMLEDFGCENRAGYFDGNGIIRDDVQNHLLQLLAVVTMERPVSLHPDDVRDERSKLLRSIRTITNEDVVLGQYTASKGKPGYHDDPGVREGSRSETYAAIRLWIDNERWAGVPFLMISGKALSEMKTEVKIRFKRQPGCLSCGDTSSHHMQNELVMQLEPSESIFMRTVVKKPGLGMRPSVSQLNLDIAEREETPTLGAYERLILDAIKGNQQHFVRRDEVRAAWAIFNPMLHAFDKDEGPPVHLYPYGSNGPQEVESLLGQVGRNGIPHGDCPVIGHGFARSRS